MVPLPPSVRKRKGLSVQTQRVDKAELVLDTINTLPQLSEAIGICHITIQHASSSRPTLASLSKHAGIAADIFVQRLQHQIFRLTTLPVMTEMRDGEFMGNEQCPFVLCFDAPTTNSNYPTRRHSRQPIMTCIVVALDVEQKVGMVVLECTGSQ